MGLTAFGRKARLRGPEEYSNCPPDVPPGEIWFPLPYKEGG